MTKTKRIRVAREDQRTTMEHRPTCETPGCTNKAKYHYQYEDGTYLWRTRNGRYICNTHQKQIWHPYLKYRKDYCENRDGRLGFKCTTNLIWSGMLDVDHKNGDPTDNRPRNLQTLCKCCHAYKTHKNGDTLTPGRDSLKRKSK